MQNFKLYLKIAVKIPLNCGLGLVVLPKKPVTASVFFHNLRAHSFKMFNLFLEHWSLLLLIFLGIGAGFINVVAGGGSILTLPMMVEFIGMDRIDANGTNRVAILMQNISAVFSFKKEGYSDYKTSFSLFLMCFPGAILGSWLGTKLDGKNFDLALGIAMLIMMLLMLKPNKKNEEFQIKKISIRSIKGWITMTSVGFYIGFIQVGVGLILMTVLNRLSGMQLIKINMHKVFIILCCTIIALGMFAFKGHVLWGLGLALASGYATGAWIATKLSIKKGDKFIRFFMLIILLIMSIKLLLGDWILRLFVTNSL